MLRYSADRRTLLYLVGMTALLAWQWSLNTIQPALYVLHLFLSIAMTVISHNHNHLPMWRSKKLNAITDYWLTLLYGFPAFAWIPTHNLNHHRYTNREGDYTITYRLSERNNLFTLLSYPAISTVYQQKPTRLFLATMWHTNRLRFFRYIGQYITLVIYVGVLLWLDWRKALYLVIIPHQVALFTVLTFNYLQHVGTDEESRYNHSRNIVGPLMNLLLFNNGYHTVHHDNPSTHWSELPSAHAQVADRIHPQLNERSFWWLVLRTYFLAPLIPRLRQASMRLERIKRESAPDNDESQTRTTLAAFHPEAAAKS